MPSQDIPELQSPEDKFDLYDFDELDFMFEVPKGTPIEHVENALFDEFPDKFPVLESKVRFNRFVERTETNIETLEPVKASSLSFKDFESFIPLDTEKRPPGAAKPERIHGSVIMEQIRRIGQINQIVDLEIADFNQEMKDFRMDTEAGQIKAAIVAQRIRSIREMGKGLISTTRLSEGQIIDQRQREFEATRPNAAEIFLSDLAKGFVARQEKDDEQIRGLELSFNVDLEEISLEEAQMFAQAGMNSSITEDLETNIKSFMDDVDLPVGFPLEVYGAPVDPLVSFSSGIQSLTSDFIKATQEGIALEMNPIERAIAASLDQGDDRNFAGFIGQQLYGMSRFIGAGQPAIPVTDPVTGEITHEFQFYSMNPVEFFVAGATQEGIIPTLLFDQDVPIPEPEGVVNQLSLKAGHLLGPAPEFFGTLYAVAAGTAATGAGPAAPYTGMAAAFIVGDLGDEVVEEAFFNTGVYAADPNAIGEKVVEWRERAINDAILGASFATIMGLVTKAVGGVGWFTGLARPAGVSSASIGTDLLGQVMADPSSFPNITADTIQDAVLLTTLSVAHTRGTNRSVIEELIKGVPAADAAMRRVGINRGESVEAKARMDEVKFVLEKEFDHFTVDESLSFIVRGTNPKTAKAIANYIVEDTFLNANKFKLFKEALAEKDVTLDDIGLRVDRTFVEEIEKGILTARSTAEADAFIAKMMNKYNVDSHYFFKRFINEHTNLNINQFPLVRDIPRPFAPEPRADVSMYPQPKQLTTGFSEGVRADSPPFVRNRPDAKGDLSYEIVIPMADGTSHIMQQTYHRRQNAELAKRGINREIERDAEMMVRLRDRADGEISMEEIAAFDQLGQLPVNEARQAIRNADYEKAVREINTTQELKQLGVKADAESRQSIETSISAEEQAMFEAYFADPVVEAPPSRPRKPKSAAQAKQEARKPKPKLTAEIDRLTTKIDTIGLDKYIKELETLGKRHPSVLELGFDPVQDSLTEPVLRELIKNTLERARFATQGVEKDVVIDKRMKSGKQAEVQQAENERIQKLVSVLRTDKPKPSTRRQKAEAIVEVLTEDGAKSVLVDKMADAARRGSKGVTVKPRKRKVEPVETEPDVTAKLAVSAERNKARREAERLEEDRLQREADGLPLDVIKKRAVDGLLGDEVGMANFFLFDIHKLAKDYLRQMKALDKDDPAGNAQAIARLGKKLEALAEADRMVAPVVEGGDIKAFNHDVNIVDLSRRQLQQLSKIQKLPGNVTNVKMIEALERVQQTQINNVTGTPGPDSVKEAAVNADIAAFREGTVQVNLEGARSNNRGRTKHITRFVGGVEYESMKRMTQIARQTGDPDMLLAVELKRMQDGVSQETLREVGDIINEIQRGLRRSEIEAVEEIAFAQFVIDNPKRNFGGSVNIGNMVAKLNNMQKTLGPDRFIKLQEKAGLIQKFFDSRLRKSFEEGMITQETFDKLVGKTYLPIEVLENIDPGEFGAGIRKILGPRIGHVGPGPKAGETRTFYFDIIDQIATVAKLGDSAIRRDNFKNQLADVLVNNEVAGQNIGVIAIKKSTGPGGRDVSWINPKTGKAGLQSGEAHLEYFKNGEEARMIVDREFAESINHVSDGTSVAFWNEILRVMSLSEFRRKAGTGFLNPLFFIPNTGQEIMYNAVASGQLGETPMRATSLIKLPDFLFGKLEPPVIDLKTGKIRRGRIPKTAPSVPLPKLRKRKLAEGDPNKVFAEFDVFLDADGKTQYQTVQVGNLPITFVNSIHHQIATLPGAYMPRLFPNSWAAMLIAEGKKTGNVSPTISGQKLLGKDPITLIEKKAMPGLGTPGTLLNRLTSGVGDPNSALSKRFPKTAATFKAATGGAFSRQRTGAYTVRSNEVLDLRNVGAKIAEIGNSLNAASDINSRAAWMRGLAMERAKQLGISLKTLVQRHPREIEKIASSAFKGRLDFSAGDQYADAMNSMSAFFKARGQVARGSARGLRDNSYQSFVDFQTFLLGSLGMALLLTSKEYNELFQAEDARALANKIPVYKVPFMDRLRFLQKDTGQEKVFSLGVQLNQAQAVGNAMMGVTAAWLRNDEEMGGRAWEILLRSVNQSSGTDIGILPGTLQFMIAMSSKRQTGTDINIATGDQAVVGAEATNRRTRRLTRNVLRLLPEGLQPDAAAFSQGVQDIIPHNAFIRYLTFVANEQMVDMPVDRRRMSYLEMLTFGMGPVANAVIDEGSFNKTRYRVVEESATAKRFIFNNFDDVTNDMMRRMGNLNLSEDRSEVVELYKDFLRETTTLVNVAAEADPIRVNSILETGRNKQELVGEIIQLRDISPGHVNLYLSLTQMAAIDAGVAIARHESYLKNRSTPENLEDFTRHLQNVFFVKEKTDEWFGGLARAYGLEKEGLKDKAYNTRLDALTGVFHDVFTATLGLMGSQTAGAAEMTPAEIRQGAHVVQMSDQLSQAGREGFSPTAYKDTRGVWTVGYGQNIQALIDRGDLPKDTNPTVYRLPAGEEGLALAKRWLNRSLNIATDDARKLFPRLDTFDQPRLEALTEFSFVFGANRMRKFPDMIAAINTGKGSFRKAALDLVLVDTKAGNEPSKWWTEDRDRAVFVAKKLLLNKPIRIEDVRREIRAHPDRNPRQDLGL